MRFGWVAAAAAMLAAVPAGAATIVQFDSEAGALAGFEGFNSRRGTLNKVTLDITIYKYRAWQVDAVLPVGTVKQVDWKVDGLWSLAGSQLRQTNNLYVPITGSGTSFATLSGSYDGRSYGYFDVRAEGAASIDLDPAGFIDQHRYFDGADTGYRDPLGLDTTLTATGANRFLRISGACFASTGSVGYIPEDFCGNAAYRLTYDYTPAIAAVPEASTWSMLVLGFVGVGFILRRRRGSTATSLSSLIY